MRSAMRPRYYCDHCNKGGGNPAAILKHERSCTANPNRECGCCRMMGNKQEPITDLISALGNGDQEGLDRLTALADGCPACILAAIRQSGLQCGPDEEGNGFSVDFDFKAAMREWNKEYYYHYPEERD